ncbi:hypothetical protein NADFUDRAFT_51851 [Nadsonia fulvescens var. elongata DSM 6958]|uniref:Checkpoint protein n=1 Tax=Nadsonia fulvescens var. elongata DSM 6958 TaxID=857566 RepID=A0A1E3PII1_9ASCO|nr:hypothetical protein NADFUDRAFT_51851 [Nadsonia fulvescens var. elongata DSM 6958]
MVQMRLDNETLKIISIPDRDSGKTQIWSVQAVSEVFQEISLSMKEGVIIFDISIENLQRALKTHKNSFLDEVMIRLRRIEGEVYLCIHYLQEHDSGEEREILQEIPIILRSPSIELQDVVEPEYPPTDLYVLLPETPNSLMRTCDRYRQLDENLIIKANSKGNLIISVESEFVKVVTTWEGLSNPELSLSQNPDTVDQNEEKISIAEVMIKCKDWWYLLQMTEIASKIIIGIVDERALVAYCYMSPTLESDMGVATYYINSISK